jgi:amino acid permease
MNIVIILSVLICCVLYIPVGIFGYLIYGSATEGDILLNFGDTETVGAIGRLCVGVTASLSYVTNNFPARSAMLSLVFRNRPITNFVWVAITLVLFVFNLLIALFVSKIDIVFSIIGSTGAVMVIFIFPALSAWKLRDKNSNIFPLIQLVVMFSIGLGIAGVG